MACIRGELDSLYTLLRLSIHFLLDSDTGYVRRLDNTSKEANSKVSN
jgi:hypothetical protein